MEYQKIAHIFAGSDKRIDGTLKQELDMGGASLLENTIQTCLNSEMLTVATVREEKNDYDKKYFGNKSVIILNSRISLLSSAIYGLMEGVVKSISLPEFRKGWLSLRDIKDYIKETPEVLELSVLYVGSDSPFMSSFDIFEFHDRFRKSDSDLYVGMTDVKKVQDMNKDLRLELNKKETTVLNYCVSDRGIYRINNMYMIRPFKIINSDLTGVFQKVFDNREVSKSTTAKIGIMNGIKTLVLKGITKPKPTYCFIRDIRRSLDHVSQKKMNKALILENTEKNASKVLGINVKIDLEGNIGPMLDVDDVACYETFNERYEDIVNYLSTQKFLRDYLKGDY